FNRQPFWGLPFWLVPFWFADADFLANARKGTLAAPTAVALSTPTAVALSSCRRVRTCCSFFMGVKPLRTAICQKTNLNVYISNDLAQHARTRAPEVEKAGHGPSRPRSRPKKLCSAYRPPPANTASWL